MELTERNVKVARRIVDIMAEEKCTVADAQDILRCVTSTIDFTATVQPAEAGVDLRMSSGATDVFLDQTRIGTVTP